MAIHIHLHRTVDSRVRTGDPLTSKGSKILSAMRKKYGKEKGKQVFYASKNKGTIKGVDGTEDQLAQAVFGKVMARKDLNTGEKQAMANDPATYPAFNKMYPTPGTGGRLAGPVGMSATFGNTPPEHEQYREEIAIDRAFKAKRRK